jgi:hypothetical protein
MGENGEFDATLPLHDSNGKIIGAAGMDFTRAPGQTKQTITQQAEKLTSELKKRSAPKRTCSGRQKSELRRKRTVLLFT